jgi:hypothetical protein
MLLFVDGLSSRYIERGICPNVSRMAERGFYLNLEPIFAFTGIGATIFTGAWPNSTGVWVEYVLRTAKTQPSSRRDRFADTFMRLTDSIPNDRICWDVRLVLNRLAGKRYLGTPAVIPSEFLRYFTTKLQKNYTDENSLGSIKTIFDVLGEAGRSYNYYPASRSDERLVRKILDSISRNSLADFTFLHLFFLDPAGHKYGPESDRMANAVRKTDEYVGRIARTVESSGMNLILFSDHGMSPVNEYCDVTRMLKSLPIDFGKDYLVFLDSTMARFWFKNQISKELITDALSRSEQGHILDNDDLCHFHIDKLGSEQGELIFVLKDYCCINPDFFRRHSEPKGMHGYAFPEHDEPVLVSPNLANPRPKIQFVDIMPTVLRLLDVDIPSSCEGRSFA